MKKKLQLFTASLALIAGVLSPALVAVPAAHASATDEITNGLKATGADNSGGASLEDNIKIITNVLLFILGAIAVIMIIIGGIRYATSNGDSSAIQGAKNTILYAVIGLIVAILAYAIVNFVVTAFVKK